MDYTRFKKHHIGWDNPLFPFLQETTVFKAFGVNAFATALIVTVAIYFQKKFDKNTRHLKIDWKSLFFTFITTWLAAWAVYIFLRYLVGYGPGMVGND